MEASAASNNLIQFSGQFSQTMNVNGNSANGFIFVGKNNNVHNLLGLDFMDILNLWDLNQFCDNVRRSSSVHQVFDQQQPASMVLNISSRHPPIHNPTAK
ncbi:unnamed protein product [Anisakis simplex]|uniref:Pepsin-I3 domain-containing protein n=1 Tax=Anisakis simplex TaxID=6269 RepID=A0A0M3IZG0_ANISI|nr:unnamed protein product [Anisakis simplex]